MIVDEIHALARDKRGSHLALSLERLEALCATPPVRIGLSATQKPIDEIARFLVGAERVDAAGQPDCTHHRRRPRSRSGSGGRSAAERAVGRLHARAMGRDLRPAGRIDRRASQHADLRQHAAVGRTRRPSLARTAGRRRRGQPSRQPVAEIRQSAEQRLKAGELKGDRRHRVAGTGHRHRLHRPGLPDRLAAVDRHVLAAGRPGRAIRWA